MSLLKCHSSYLYSDFLDSSCCSPGDCWRWGRTTSLPHSHGRAAGRDDQAASRGLQQEGLPPRTRRVHRTPHQACTVGWGVGTDWMWHCAEVCEEMVPISILRVRGLICFINAACMIELWSIGAAISPSTPSSLSNRCGAALYACERTRFTSTRCATSAIVAMSTR